MLARRLSVVVLVGLALLVSSCAPSLVGSDAGSYSGTKLYAVTDRDLATVYEAAVRALGELELTPTENVKDVFAAKVVARAADDKTITVRIKPGDDGRTNLTIQVGSVGDRQRSTVIYDRIRKNLGLSK